MKLCIKIIVKLLLLISSMELGIKIKQNSIPINYTLLNWKRPREIKLEKSPNYDSTNAIKNGKVFHSSTKNYDTKDNNKTISAINTNPKVPDSNLEKKEKEIRRLDEVPGVIVILL